MKGMTNMDNNRPRSREKNVTNNSKGVARRGDGLSGNSSVKPTQSHTNTGTSSSNGAYALGGGKKASPLLIVVVIVGFLLLRGFSALGGGAGAGSGNSNPDTDLQLYDDTNSGGNTNVVSAGDSLGYTDNNNYLGNLVTNNYPDGTSNAGSLDASVPEGCRDKFTTIKGNGQDTVTIMVYLCGTDLESKHGMASKDLKEMTNATIGNNVNILVYSGGCKKWQNSLFSNKTNQIWRVANGGVECLVDNDGDKSMTDPNTLSSFIKWCNLKYPANRRMLILWDHGGGSVTGYGHDERPGHSGSMTLANINKALSDAGSKYDFIGFDACLMATLEAGLTLEPYADYYIASEETEPGVGWYYTNWITALSANTSMATVDIGKQIIDDYVTECNRSCNGQKTTLSIVDLAQLKKEIPDKFKSFASSMNTMLDNNQYKQISDARYQTKEFGQSASIDHVDLVDLSKNMSTSEGQQLADAVLSCVKYNRTSSNMKNSYGISVYFPYRKVNRVDQAVTQYNALGMDSEYTKCIRSFAQIEVSGQTSSNGTSSAANSLFNIPTSGDSNSINSLVDMFNFFTNREMPEDQVNDYVNANKLDASLLTWKEVNGKKVIALTEEQWSLVHDITINMFYDDGTGYIDLGYDNLFEFDEEGNMIGDTDTTWIALDGQPVAYYYMDTVEEGDRNTITGYVPVLLNGDRMNLILIFDTDHPNGYIAGAREDYDESETETVAKALVQLKEGDKLDFICNYYDYEGNFQDSYFLGEQMTLTKLPEISNVPIDGTTKTTYRFTDIYNQTYWTPVLQ